MELFQEHNPAVPSALAMPRYLPRLSDAEHSHAIREAEQRRIKVYLYCLALIYLPLFASLPLGPGNNTRAILVGFAGAIYLGALALSNHPIWRTSRVLIVTALTVLFALITFPESEATANKALHCSFLLILLSGALFLSPGLRA